jgi:hypothetical protein
VVRAGLRKPATGAGITDASLLHSRLQFAEVDTEPDSTRTIPSGGSRGQPIIGAPGPASLAEGGFPHAMLGAKALDLAQLDVGVLGPVRSFASHPPPGAGQARRKVRPGPGIMPLPRPARLGYDLAVSGLPQPDRSRLTAEHDGVIPAPHHNVRSARHLSDGYQVTRQDPLPARRRELRCVPDRANLPPGQNLAGILLGMQHDATTQARGNQDIPSEGATGQVCASCPVWCKAVFPVLASGVSGSADRATCSGRARLRRRPQ